MSDVATKPAEEEVYAPQADDKLYRFDVDIFCGGCKGAVTRKLKKTQPTTPGIRGYEVISNPDATGTVNVYTAPETELKTAYKFVVDTDKMVFKKGAVSRDSDTWEVQEVMEREAYKALSTPEKKDVRKEKMEAAASEL